MKQFEWSEDLKKSAKNVTYFSGFAILVGYLEIEKDSSFFGVRIVNFDQKFLYFSLLAIATYWLLVLSTRFIEERSKLNSGLKDFFELSELNTKHIDSINNSIYEIEKYNNPEYLERCIHGIGGISPSNDDLFREHYENGIKSFINENRNYKENLIAASEAAKKLYQQNKKFFLLRWTVAFRFIFLDAFTPILLFLISLSALKYGIIHA